ncbi:MAG: hypothetical protein WBF71_07530 [Microthrixaceae bacterium]
MDQSIPGLLLFVFLVLLGTDHPGKMQRILAAVGGFAQQRR